MEYWVGFEPTTLRFCRPFHLSTLAPVQNGGNGETRTRTLQILSLLTLPIGLHSHIGAEGGTRTHRTLFLRQVCIPNSITTALFGEVPR